MADEVALGVVAVAVAVAVTVAVVVAAVVAVVAAAVAWRWRWHLRQRRRYRHGGVGGGDGDGGGGGGGGGDIGGGVVDTLVAAARLITAECAMTVCQLTRLQDGSWSLRRRPYAGVGILDDDLQSMRQNY